MQPARAKRRSAPASAPLRGRVSLRDYTVGDYDPGRGFFTRAVWHLINTWIIRNDALPFSRLRVFLLRLFGARIGAGVVMQHGINVKYPWNLAVGDHSWIGESVWLDTLGEITIGSNVVVSQGAFLLTGNHDWSDPLFGLRVQPIILEDECWIGAGALVCPGVRVGSQAVLSAGSVATGDLAPHKIHVGNPAQPVRDRVVRR